MDTNQWFREQLQSSADGFVWGAEQVSESHRYIPPPKGLGEWTVARHVFHMLYYEQQLHYQACDNGLVNRVLQPMI